MKRDFEIKMGIHLIQPPHELDLHNNFEFKELSYSIQERNLTLLWQRSKREGVGTKFPTQVAIVFCGVTDFQFRPRDPKLPFTEDDCLSSFGYWTDEEWAQNSVIIGDEPQNAEAHWKTAIKFMSGAIVTVQANSAQATITV